MISKLTKKNKKKAFLILAVIISLLAISLYLPPPLVWVWPTFLTIGLIEIGLIVFIAVGVSHLRSKPAVGLLCILLGSVAILVSMPLVLLSIGSVGEIFHMTSVASPLAKGIQDIPGVKQYCTERPTESLGGSGYSAYYMAKESKAIPQSVTKILSNWHHTPVSQDATKSTTKNQEYADNGDEYDDITQAGSVVIDTGNAESGDSASVAVYTSGSKITTFCSHAPLQTTVPSGKMLIDLEVYMTYQNSSLN